jgi:hypothetical protein
MSDPKKIKIDTVNGGRPQDHEALKRNYFEATTVNDTYLFYSPDGEQIQTNPPVLADNRGFSFELREMPGVMWTVSNFAIDHLAASGHWNNGVQIANDDGTFTAQAGGTLEEEPGEDASAASA